MGLLDECTESMIANKSIIIKLGIAKFVQNTFFFALYYSIYVKPAPIDACADTWWALGAQSLDCGPLLAVGVIGYLIGAYYDNFTLFAIFFFLVHAPLGLFVYTPLIVITGKSLLTGDGLTCSAANPDAGFLLVTYELEVWLYTTYTAMMCVILYLACGKVVLKSFGYELL